MTKGEIATMNRHRNNWSVMGIEPRTEEKALSYTELKKRLEYLIAIWGFSDVANELRKIHEEDNNK